LSKMMSIWQNEMESKDRLAMGLLLVIPASPGSLSGARAGIQ
jgi:hypothetical protein